MATELAITVPAFLALLALVFLGGQMGFAEEGVQSAADEAARRASIARDAGTARSAAQDAAYSALEEEGLGCVSREVAVDTSAFAAPVGTPGMVQVTVTCTVDGSSVWLPSGSGIRTLTATTTSPLDSHRGRG